MHRASRFLLISTEKFRKARRLAADPGDDVLMNRMAARRMTMELSMTIALVAAVAIGEFFTALVIVLFVLVAEVLEGLTVDRGRRAIKDLLFTNRKKLLFADIG
jgi:cation transport ATPase